MTYAPDRTMIDFRLAKVSLNYMQVCVYDVD